MEANRVLARKGVWSLPHFYPAYVFEYKFEGKWRRTRGESGEKKVFFSHTHFSFLSRAHKFIHQVNFFFFRKKITFFCWHRNIFHHTSHHISLFGSIMLSQTCFNGNRRRKQILNYYQLQWKSLKAEKNLFFYRTSSNKLFGYESFEKSKGSSKELILLFAFASNNNKCLRSTRTNIVHRWGWLDESRRKLIIEALWRKLRGQRKRRMAKKG